MINQLRNYRKAGLRVNLNMPAGLAIINSVGEVKLSLELEAEQDTWLIMIRVERWVSRLYRP